MPALQTEEWRQAHEVLFSIEGFDHIRGVNHGENRHNPSFGIVIDANDVVSKPEDIASQVETAITRAGLKGALRPYRLEFFSHP